MSERYDAIIIGAGHNGLVCAGLLAKAGKRVLVLEENDQVGGASVTRSFADGYSVSSCAHLLYQLQPVVCKELGIDIDFAATDMETIALSQDGNHLRLAAGKVTGVSETDAREYTILSTFHIAFALRFPISHFPFPISYSCSP